jgi:large subunit ribosomal protein L3
MGANTSPGRVFKNKRLPGHYGVENVTIQNLEVMKVDSERNFLMIKGAVPGAKGVLLVVRDAVKK